MGISRYYKGACPLKVRLTSRYKQVSKALTEKLGHVTGHVVSDEKG